MHYARIESERREHIARAKERRNYERKLAADRLNAAREREKQFDNKVTKAVEKFTASHYRLAEAKANLAKTAAELNRLGKRELELV